MNRKAPILVVGVFLLGVAVGGLGAHLLADRFGVTSGAGRETRPSREEASRQERDSLVQQLTTELGLTADQQAQLIAVLDEIKQNYDTIHAQMKPQFKQAREEGRNRVRAFLSPEQRPKFEEWLRRVDEERKKKECR